MHRADGRGIDRLDLTNLEQLDVLIAGRGGNPQNSGMKASSDNFAPRARRDLPHEREDGVPHRLRPDLQRDALGARAARRQRLSGHDRVELPQRRCVRLLQHACSRASRRSSRPTRAPAASRWIARRPCTRRRSATSIAATSRPGTSRSSAACMFDIVRGRRLRRRQGDRRLRRARHQRAADARRRRRGPAVFVARTASIALNSWGQRLKTDYHSLQVALNKPFTHGLLFKGAYTLQQVDERERRRRPSDADLEHARASCTATGRPPGSTGRTTSRWASPTRCRGRANGGYDNIVKAIINDWQVNGVFAAFSGTPFTVTASGTALNTPSNHADGRPRRHVHRDSATSAPTATWFDTAAFAQPTGVRFGNTGRNQFYGPGG